MPLDLAAPPSRPEEVSLAGVTATIRPLTGALTCRADAETVAALADLRKGGQAAARFGLDSGELADPAAQSGLSRFAKLVTLGSLLIASWDVARDGQPVKVDQASVAALFNLAPEVMDAFGDHVLSAASRRAEASFRSAASPSTTSDEAATTAAAVTEPTPPAAEAFPDPPADSAQPSSSSPATPKLSRPGARSADTAAR